MKKIVKHIFLFLPLIYSLLRLASDLKFYFIFSGIYIIFILIYYINKNKNYYSYLSQLGISFIFLDLTFHNIDFKLFFESFKLIKLKIVLLIIPVLFLVLYIRSFKWKYLFSHVKKLKVSSLFKTVIVGFMVNSILPARAGELYRAYFLNKLEKISKSTILGTVALERAFDGLVIGVGVVLIFFLNIIQNKIFYKVGMLGLSIYLFAVIFLIIFYFNKNLILNIIKKMLFFIPDNLMDKLILILEKFYEGLHVFKNFKKLIYFTIFTFVLWLVIGFVNYLFLYSMDIFNIFSMNFSPVFFVLLFVCVSAFGVSIPSGPGAIGPLQASIFFSFYLVNSEFVKVNTVEHNIIATFSIYIWLFQVLFYIISGLIVFTREHIKFKPV